MPQLQFLGIAIGKFVDEDKTATIHNFFKPVSERSTSVSESKNNSSTSGVEVDDNKAIAGTSDQRQEEEEEAEERPDCDTLISLDELFPDLQNVDENIVPHLPKKLQHELRKRLKCETRECPVCQEHVLPSLLSKHMITHTAPNECDNLRNCHICGMQLPAAKIAEHISTHNTQHPKETSVEQPRRFSRKRHLPNNKLMGCPVCAKHFPANQIDNHMLSHSYQEEQGEEAEDKNREYHMKTHEQVPQVDNSGAEDKNREYHEQVPQVDNSGAEVQNREYHEQVPQVDNSGAEDKNREYHERVPQVDNSGAEDKNREYHERVPQVDNSGAEVHKCSTCGEHITLSEYLEHLDFHTAQELHRELNEAVRPPPSTAPPAKKKRGRPSKKPVASANKNVQCITAFFTPK